MNASARTRPALTVAAIVEHEGRFLVVREETPRGLRINQPAGHLEGGESLVAAAARETLEESAWNVEPFALVGVYRWEAPDNGETFVRVAFAARAIAHEAGRVLDEGIHEALWLGYDEIAARHREHRSPLVQRCFDDYRAGRRWPIDIVRDVARELPA